MVLGEHQRPPALVERCLPVAVAVHEVGDDPCLFGHDELVLRFAHLLRDALQDLAAPHEAYADIFLRHAVVVGAPAVGHPFEILPPRDVDRVVADAVA